MKTDSLSLMVAAVINAVLLLLLMSGLEIAIASDVMGKDIARAFSMLGGILIVVFVYNAVLKEEDKEEE